MAQNKPAFNIPLLKQLLHRPANKTLILQPDDPRRQSYYPDFEVFLDKSQWQHGFNLPSSIVKDIKQMRVLDFFTDWKGARDNVTKSL